MSPHVTLDNHSSVEAWNNSNILKFVLRRFLKFKDPQISYHLTSAVERRRKKSPNYHVGLSGASGAFLEDLSRESEKIGLNS